MSGADRRLALRARVLALAAAEVLRARISLANDRLSRAASAVHRIEADHAYGAELDAGFDAGEWSGPAHWEAEEREVDAALAALGFTRATYNAAIAQRLGATYRAHALQLPTVEELGR